MSAPPTENDTAAAQPVPLVDTATELREHFGLTVPYQVLWTAAVNGTIPASRLRGRWYTLRADHPRIAATLSGGRQPAGAGPSERSPAAA